MTVHRLSPLVAAVLVGMLSSASVRSAQGSEPRDELLRYVPRDSGLCLVINDLRVHAAKWDASPWIKTLEKSSLGLAFLDSPEFKSLLKFQQDLKKHVDIDWPTLRDDVLGDAVVFAYRPAPADKPNDEQGLLLVHARKPDVLRRLMANLNRAQQASGELKALETRSFKGTEYQCRVEPRVSHFYLLSDTFFAFTGREELIHKIIEARGPTKSAADPRDQRTASGIGPEAPPAIAKNKSPATSAAPSWPLVEHLQRTETGKAVASLWINPRSFDADLKHKARDLQTPDGFLFRAIVKYWDAFDGVVCSFALDGHLEFKVSLLARTQQLPESARWIFEPVRPSDLWRRFPENAVVSMAGRIDPNDLAESALDFPVEVRKAFLRIVQPVAALGKLDLARDVAPNVGPDIGVCVVRAADAGMAPQVIVAVAVRPGAKEAAVDQGLYRGVHFLAALSIYDFNRRHPRDPIRLHTLNEDRIEIKYLANDQLFPHGFQPACALKDGFLLVTTSPEAVGRFRTPTGPAAFGGEAPLVRISAPELARLLRQQRQAAIDQLAARNQISKIVAAQTLEESLATLDLFERIELVHRGGAGQASLILRARPAHE